MNSESASPQNRRLSEWLIQGSFFGLFLVYTLATLLLPPEGRQANVVVWLIQVVPLSIFIPGVWQMHRRTLVAACFIVLFYFVISVTEVLGPLPRILDFVELGLLCLFFTAVITYIRGQQRVEAALAKE